MKKMRKFKIQYPDENYNNVVEILTEEYIRRYYYPTWREKWIEKYNQDIDDEVCFNDCLDHWVVTHWAIEIEDV